MPGNAPLKDRTAEKILFRRRALVLAAMVMLLSGGLLGRAYYLQIHNHQQYMTLSEENQVKGEFVPPIRGLIYDSEGTVLAQNQSALSLVMVPEQVTDLASALKRLSDIVVIDDYAMEQFHKQLKRKRRFDKVVIKRKLTETEAARFSARRYQFPGISIEGRLYRDYPMNGLFSHVIGYVGPVSDRDRETLDPTRYQPNDVVGKIGIEKAFEETLRGESGFRQVEVNVYGRVLRVLTEDPATQGDPIHLTVNSRLQQAAVDALGDDNGAVVAMDPNNGNVLALVSKPLFDPNLFSGGISTAQYNDYLNSPNRPLFHRALQGQYPPGSTLKPFLTLAALNEGIVSKHTRYYCPGWYRLEGHTHTYRCWNRWGHGRVNARQANAQSCDVFFYELAHQLGINQMHHYLSLFSFGRPTGLDLPGERKGLIPSVEWKRKVKNEPWYPGETLIAGIGQGYNLVTPIQLATAVATLANRGNQVIPTIIASNRPNQGSSTNSATANVSLKNEGYWSEVIGAMVDTVHGTRGTAREIGVNSAYRIAGKTGTAQVFGIAQDAQYDEDTIKKKLRDHALFIAFAPAEQPKIALAVIVENGGSGSSVAAPIAKTILDKYLLELKPITP